MCGTCAAERRAARNRRRRRQETAARAPAVVAGIEGTLRRGPGRPPLDPDGSVELRVRVTQALAQRAEEIARREGLTDRDGRPILAAVVRLALERLE